jgi:N-methylhydantoinase A
LRFEVDERVSGSGEIVTALDEAQLEQLSHTFTRLGVESIAISFLNAYANPFHEQRAVELLHKLLPDVYVCSGTQISREWYEFERSSTAVANAYVGPSAKRYIDRFGERLEELGLSGPFCMMASNGGVLTPRQTVAQPVALIESGPIGGCIGAGAYADALGRSKMVAFDMGGTTAKCAVLENGRFDVLSTYYIEGAERGYPVRANVLDIVEVGAGGGSIASVTPEGRLLVGPRSAGAEPGPVAFGRGGTEPTVTDANLVLGRIGTGAFLGGRFSLDRDAAAEAIMDRVGRPLGYDDQDVDKVALGILNIAATIMAGAIKEVTIERGLDIRDFDLFVFGGGGPLHGAALARELRIPRVIVPREPGNFSAVGMLMAEPKVNASQTFFRDLDDDAALSMEQVLDGLAVQCRSELEKEFNRTSIEFERHAEMRYKGQHHALRIPLAADRSASALRSAFDDHYALRYGHSEPECAVELVGLHVIARGAGDKLGIVTGPVPARGSIVSIREIRSVYFAEASRRLPTPIYTRGDLPVGFSDAGPAVVEEYGSTTVIGPLDRFEIGEFGEIWIHCDH